MDIKSLARSILPFDTPGRVEAKKQAKTESATEREGNGQMPQGEQQETRRELTPEEIQEAVQFLENLSGVRENGLNVRLEQSDGITVVYVEEPNGKVVRRIPAAELTQLTKDRQRQSGHLLNKAM